MKLHIKILAQVLGISLAVALVYTWLQSRKDREHLYEAEKAFQEQQLATALSPLARSLWEMNKGNIRTTVIPFLKFPYVKEFTVVDDQGRLVLGLRRNLETGGVDDMENAPGAGDLGDIAPDFDAKKFSQSSVYTDRRVIIDRRELENRTRVVSPIRFLDETGKDVLLGYAIVTYSTEHLEAQMRMQVVRFLAWTLVLSTINALLIVLILRRSVVARIGVIARASQEVSAGKFLKVAANRGKDEISQLTASFNRMVKALELQVHGLTSLRIEGAKIVRCRTGQELVGQIWDSLEVISAANCLKRLFLHDSYLDVNGAGEVFLELDQEGRFKEGRHNLCPEPLAGESKLAILDREKGGVAASIYLQESGLEARQVLLIQALGNYIGSALGNISFVKKLRGKARQGKELEAARLVQETLLPPQQLMRFGNLDVFSHSRVANECGGDWWGIFELDSQRSLVLVGDVTGHGISSALVTAVVTGYTETLSSGDRQAPGEILADLSTVLSSMGKTDRLMTMFAVIVDKQQRVLTFANAGHNFPFVKRKGGGGKWERLVLPGARLGHQAYGRQLQPYKEKTVPFEAGDSLFLYTDGLVDGSDLEGQPWGEFRLRLALESAGDAGPQQLVEAVVADSSRFFGKTALEDDLTLIAVRLGA